MIGALLIALAMQRPDVIASPMAPPPAVEARLLRQGTPIRFVTEATIDSRSARQGERFGLVVKDDVQVDKIVVISGGTRGVGEVQSISSTGGYGKAGVLVLQPLFIDISGQRINLVGHSATEGRDKLGEAAVAGFLIGFGSFITGKTAIVPAGSDIYGAVRDDTLLHR